MKKILLISLLVTLGVIVKAQGTVVKASGKIISRQFDYEDFDKVEISRLNGKIEIETGKPFSVNMSLDDNLESFLVVTVSNGTLEISFKNKTKDWWYIEGADIKLKITMPAISFFRNSSNSEITIMGLDEKYFKFDDSGNGDALLSGTVAELSIIKKGNGDIWAENLYSGKTIINKKGNGDIIIHTDLPFLVNGSGNGDITNRGKGHLDESSMIRGNGKVKTKD